MRAPPGDACRREKGVAEGESFKRRLRKSEEGVDDRLKGRLERLFAILELIDLFGNTHNTDMEKAERCE